MVKTRYRGLKREHTLGMRLTTAWKHERERTERGEIRATRRKLAQRIRRLRCQARQRGYEAGRQAGESDLKAILSHYQAYSDTVHAAHRDCLEIAVAIAAEIVEADLVPNHLLLTRRIDRALRKLTRDRIVRILTAPAETDALRRYLELSLEGWSIEIAADSSIDLGDAALETPAGRIHFDWREQLATIRNHYLRELAPPLLEAG
ncbi:MAG: Flagellar assembly protein FliH [Pseudomonadota bacterium]